MLDILKCSLMSPLLFGATAPSRPEPRRSRGFCNTHNDAPQSTGLLWTSDQVIAETSTCQHTILTTNIRAPGGTRTRNLSRRATADTHLDRARDRRERTADNQRDVFCDACQWGEI